MQELLDRPTREFRNMKPGEAGRFDTIERRVKTIDTLFAAEPRDSATTGGYTTAGLESSTVREPLYAVLAGPPSASRVGSQRPSNDVRGLSVDHGNPC